MSVPDIPIPPVFEPKSAAPLHRLAHSWTFWCQKKGKRREGASWYDGLTPIGRFNSIEGFWQVSLRVLAPAQRFVAWMMG